jgi:hypothetical protein
MSREKNRLDLSTESQNILAAFQRQSDRIGGLILQLQDLQERNNMIALAAIQRIGQLEKRIQELEIEMEEKKVEPGVTEPSKAP